jgi:hypothetical protein
MIDRNLHKSPDIDHLIMNVYRKKCSTIFD